MRITIVVPGIMPSTLYGGTQRVMWDLGRALSQIGHRVCFLVDQVRGNCPFAEIHQIDPDTSIAAQLPNGTDIVHFNNKVISLEGTNIPHVVTMHGNDLPENLDKNTIFVSRNHAKRHGSESYVYNGLDWDNIGPMGLSLQRSGYHFLGKAAWSVKNVRGAIKLIQHLPHEQLTVLGGYRLNLKMGFLSASASAAWWMMLSNMLSCSTRVVSSSL